MELNKRKVYYHCSFVDKFLNLKVFYEHVASAGKSVMFKL